MESDKLPSFCLRHDVDGLLWSLNEKFSLQHRLTFNAFGYVKASKCNEKFTKAAPGIYYNL